MGRTVRFGDGEASAKVKFVGHASMVGANVNLVEPASMAGANVKPVEPAAMAGTQSSSPRFSHSVSPATVSHIRQPRRAQPEHMLTDRTRSLAFFPNRLRSGGNQWETVIRGLIFYEIYIYKKL